MPVSRRTKLLEQCDDSVNGSTLTNHVSSGGSIPASSLIFKASDNAHVARLLVREYHYSHREPANVQLIGSLHLDRRMVAACFFSIPPTRWSERVIELSRLVRVEDCRVPLTMLISLSLREVRKRFDLVVSFADVSKDHHGGIYQACSWNYHCLRQPRVDANIVNGRLIPRRSCYSIFGTSSASRIALENGLEVKEHWDEGKHLYWRALSKSGNFKAIQLGLTSNPYPKPNR